MLCSGRYSGVGVGWSEALAKVVFFWEAVLGYCFVGPPQLFWKEIFPFKAIQTFIYLDFRHILFSLSFHSAVSFVFWCNCC